MRLTLLTTLLFATTINAAEKTAAEMSADADGWIFTGGVVIVILAVVGFICTFAIERKKKSDKP